MNFSSDKNDIPQTNPAQEPEQHDWLDVRDDEGKLLFQMRKDNILIIRISSRNGKRQASVNLLDYRVRLQLLEEIEAMQSA